MVHNFENYGHTAPAKVSYQSFVNETPCANVKDVCPTIGSTQAQKHCRTAGLSFNRSCLDRYLTVSNIPSHPLLFHT